LYFGRVKFFFRRLWPWLDHFDLLASFYYYFFYLISTSSLILYIFIYFSSSMHLFYPLFTVFFSSLNLTTPPQHSTTLFIHANSTRVNHRHTHAHAQLLPNHPCGPFFFKYQKRKHFVGPTNLTSPTTSSTSTTFYPLKFSRVNHGHTHTHTTFPNRNHHPCGYFVGHLAPPKKKENGLSLCFFSSIIHVYCFTLQPSFSPCLSNSFLMHTIF